MVEDYQDMIADVQKAALDIFKVFQKLCKKHNLSYFAIGGTCIGAVRHQGYIPWDDDIDVAMPFEDYEKFKCIALKELKYPYSILDPLKCKHYTGNYIKMQNQETTFVEENMKEFSDRYAGVYIDIFPVHGLPKSEKEQDRMALMCECMNKLNLRMRFPYSMSTSLQWKVTWLACGILRALKPFYFFCLCQDNMLKKFSFGNSEKILFSWRARPNKKRTSTYKNIFYYEDFKETVEVPFEDTVMAIPVGYKRYLEMDFGDYMKLPPIEDQIPRHPKVIIDLESPYTEYLEEQL